MRPHISADSPIYYGGNCKRTPRSNLYIGCLIAFIASVHHYANTSTKNFNQNDSFYVQHKWTNWTLFRIQYDGLLPCIAFALTPHACIFIGFAISTIQHSEGMMFNGACISVVFAFSCIKRRHSHTHFHT